MFYISPGGEEVLFTSHQEVRTIVKELPGGDVPPGGEGMIWCGQVIDHVYASPRWKMCRHYEPNQYSILCCLEVTGRLEVTIGSPHGVDKRIESARYPTWRWRGKIWRGWHEQTTWYAEPALKICAAIIEPNQNIICCHEVTGCQEVTVGYPTMEVRRKDLTWSTWTDHVIRRARAKRCAAIIEPNQILDVAIEVTWGIC